MTATDAAALQAAATSSKCVSVVRIPGAGHYLLEDCPRELRAELLDAILSAEPGIFAANTRERCPETLGLRTLTAFDSVEEALKVLAPRRVPTADAVAAALAEVSVGDESPDEDNDPSSVRRTALIKTDPEYFGFVG